MRWLIYGANSWIGSKIIELLQDNDEKVIKGTSRLDNEGGVVSEIIVTKPDRIIYLTEENSGEDYDMRGYLGQEEKLLENLRDNLYAPIILSTICFKFEIHLTYLGTGCIFSGYDGKYGRGYVEDDLPNFFGSPYSIVKGFTDRLMHHLPGEILNVRIRTPIGDDFHPENLIVKLMKSKKVSSIPNSATVLPDLLPVMIDMAKNKVIGTINLVNHGLISNSHILELVKEILDPDLEWEDFTVEEQCKLLLIENPNNRLDTSKLEDMYDVKLVWTAIKDSIIKMKENSQQ